MVTVIVPVAVVTLSPSEVPAVCIIGGPVRSSAVGSRVVNETVSDRTVSGNTFDQAITCQKYSVVGSSSATVPRVTVLPVSNVISGADSSPGATCNVRERSCDVSPRFPLTVTDTVDSLPHGGVYCHVPLLVILPTDADGAIVSIRILEGKKVSCTFAILRITSVNGTVSKTVFGR